MLVKIAASLTEKSIPFEIADPDFMLVVWYYVPFSDTILTLMIKILLWLAPWRL